MNVQIHQTACQNKRGPICSSMLIATQTHFAGLPLFSLDVESSFVWRMGLAMSDGFCEHEFARNVRSMQKFKEDSVPYGLPPALLPAISTRKPKSSTGFLTQDVELIQVDRAIKAKTHEKS
ncbi:hypothetical protein C8J56DRAFT_1037751 [Mycena floridula]|nr:hypothetical protein C8J56DRAFT_1037751 [Mycena floridula]